MKEASNSQKLAREWFEIGENEFDFAKKRA